MATRTLDGHAGRLHVHTWEAPSEPTHVVLIAHGYGEHIGRYDHVAGALSAGGAVVSGLDHVGHGRSDGDRALIADFGPVVDDLHRWAETTRGEHPGLPVILLGHSMGGLIATRYAQRYGDGLAAVVLSAPLVGNPGTGVLLGMDPLPEIPIDPSVLSRDAAVGQAYLDDPLVYHGGFQRPTLAAMATALLDSALDAPLVHGPVLWQHGTADALVPLEGTRRQIDLLTGAEVRTRHYPDARHEIYNEINRDEVLADTTAFIAEVVG